MRSYLTPAELHAALQSMEYRHPDIVINMFIHPYEGYRNVCVSISFEVPDSYKQGEQQRQCVNVPVPPIVSVEHFHDWLKWRLETIALHEVNEMYWVHGEILLDPHSETYWKLRQ
jgi:hypothetical protein